MTGGMVRVTNRNLTPPGRHNPTPGSDDASRAYGRGHHLMTGSMVHVTKPLRRGEGRGGPEPVLRGAQYHQP
jgi:hypothetical protein